MARFDSMRDRLPSLYRPEVSDSNLLNQLLKAIGSSLDRVNQEASDVLQSHWFAYANRALYSSFFIRSRQLQKQPFPKPTDPVLETFPYIDDLAYLAALLNILPWQDPPTQKELTEAYRDRIRRMVNLYRDGVGTVGALKRIVEAQLPVDLTAPLPERDRAFTLEEFPLLNPQMQPIQAPGLPLDRVGPLMRWSVQNSSVRAVPLTVYIQGVAPVEGSIDETQTPLIELYQGHHDLPLGIAYQDNLPEGVVLCLSPTFTSWLGTDNGILRSPLSTAESAADPTAPGPWTTATEEVTGQVLTIVQAGDRTLWLAANTDTAGLLWQHDGRSWTQVLSETAFPPIHCLAVDGQDLLIGSDRGLVRLPLFPVDDTFTPSPQPDTLEQPAVYAILKVNGTWWLGTAAGAKTLETDDTLQDTALQNTPIYTLHHDSTGTLFLGGERGLFQFQLGLNAWYFYSGASQTEQQPEWESLTPGFLPDKDQVFLPPVHAIYRGSDQSLWIGTEQGLARYIARPLRGLTYETALEAFPDLISSQVFDIQSDERETIWICSDRGLLRYDGRDVWQYQTDRWQPLGKADTLYLADNKTQPRGNWRFNRTDNQWERSNPLSDTLDLRTEAESAVYTVLWTDGAIANLGEWNGSQFSPITVDADPTLKLVMRYKLDAQRIVTGGIPAVPRLPVGSSTWRYLALEPQPFTEPAVKPAWTREGRLLPPPPDQPVDPESGRYDHQTPPPASEFDSALFAFNPAANVWFSWSTRRPFTLLARVNPRTTTEAIDPIILQRVLQGMEQVRPAGVQVFLAIGEQLVSPPPA